MDIQPPNQAIPSTTGQSADPSASANPVNPTVVAPIQGQVPQAPAIVPMSSVPASELSSSTIHTSPMIDSPTTAENNDIIEKEWVDKAKQIVDMSRSDPYVQNEQINKIKADYIKKRYNKDIKVSEG